MAKSAPAEDDSGRLSGTFRQLPDRDELLTLTGVQLRPSNDLDAMWAKLIALGARNGTEDLHVAGVFSDRQAPALNRRLRARVYEVLIALRRLDPDQADDPYRRYLQHLAAGSGLEPTQAAIAVAVERAVKDYAAAEGVDAPTAAALTEAGIDGALNHLEAVWQLDDTNMQRALAFFVSAIPIYWEHPQVSPEFQALLEGRPQSRIAHA
ncbi:MAG: hypothetical protein ABSB69_10450 [Solirubrobacteraceae bacterium]|jgi:hypothetical protein